MNDKTLEEIRDSLKRIEELATPIVIVSPIASPSEVDQLREQLKPHRIMDVKGVESVHDCNVGSTGNAYISPYLPAEALAQKQKLFSGLNTNREVLDIVNAINVLAMANTDVLHVMVEFAGHVNALDVRVNHVATNYGDANRTALMTACVYLGEEAALQELLAVESQLTELIIEAREEAEAKAEVGA
ncbi:hypothetical protein [Vibrio parahaemolyticus]|uniref:hypothetical protein n=1 Tax=Vibrio parahaemolyticus TaxID=670 RepID=UPI0005F11FF6|nr:hypothetical protein [Vibrio parahaemolyticus]TOM90375.1 hypothetical protein CGH68_09575 [Vibrio parahaemolyticus]